MSQKFNKNKIKGSLADYLRGNEEIVFHGIQKGGRLNSSISFSITPSTPNVSDFSSLFIQNYEN